MKTKLICKECGKNYFVIPYRARTGKSKYCSLKCKYKNMDYKIKKGKVTKCKNCGKEFYLYPSRLKKKEYKFCSIKCRSIAMKGIFIGKKAWNWKGNKVSYQALHTWVKIHLKKPIVCSVCNKRKTLEWANKNHLYKRNLKDWIAMCHSCHCKYDQINKLKRNK